MHLFIEIFDNKALAAIWKDGSLNRTEQIDFKVRTEIGTKDSFIELLSRFGSLSDFDQVTCSFAQTDFTLIPSPLFQVSEADSFLQFTTTNAISKSEVDYSRLNYFNCVGVYLTPGWIKSVLVPKFPRVVIAHERIHFLRKMEQVSSGLSQLTAVVHEKHALFAYVSKGELIWQLSSTIDHTDDILYHLLNAVERLQIATVSVVLYPAGEAAKKMCSDLNDKKNKLKQLVDLKWTISNQSHLEFQLLCV